MHLTEITIDMEFTTIYSLFNCILMIYSMIPCVSRWLLRCKIKENRKTHYENNSNITMISCFVHLASFFIFIFCCCFFFFFSTYSLFQMFQIDKVGNEFYPSSFYAVNMNMHWTVIWWSGVNCDTFMILIFV